MKVNKSNPNWMHGFPPIRMTGTNDRLELEAQKSKSVNSKPIYTVSDTIKRNNQLATIMSIFL